jgi:large subunit ribosomal protein L33
MWHKNSSQDLRDKPNFTFFLPSGIVLWSMAGIRPGIFYTNPMSQDRLIKLQCSKCKRINYWSSKNKKLVTRKIELKKFCNWCRASTVHKEAKK